MRGRLAIAATLLTLSALSAVAAYQVARPMAAEGEARWQEIAWTFPRDGRPAGRAFRCASCGEDGAAVELYVRPKIGFCNCDTGVADDDEVDRVADLDLMSEHFAPLQPGRVVRIADMPGRLRPYDLAMPDGSRRSAVGIAVSHRCDLMVAVAQGRGDATTVQRAALQFLGSMKMSNWMTAAMEG